MMNHFNGAAETVATPLAAVLRKQLRGAVDQAAMLLPDLPAIRAGADRRMATALLEEAVRIGGGTVYRTASGADLLCGTARPAAIRAAGAISRLLDGALAPPIWRLPEESGELLAWAAAEQLAPTVPRPASGQVDLAGFRLRLEGLGADQILVSNTVRDADGQPAGRQLTLHRERLIADLAASGSDADLLAHAEDRLARRLLPGLGVWAASGQGLRLIPLPFQRLPPRAQTGGAVGVVPLALADIGALGEQRQRLRELGWQLAVAGLDAHVLMHLQALALPADLLLLRWSPALADRELPAAAPRERLFLTAADAAGRAWAACARIGLIESAP